MYYMFRKKGVYMTEHKPTDERKRTYTVNEIASILNIGRTSAYKLVNKGYFHVVRIGNTIRISKKSFDMWLDKLDQ